MAAPRSMNSWDLSVEIIESDGAKLLFFDKRDDFDLLPVNEPTGEGAVRIPQIIVNN